jgi:L-lactate dehydrogenase complex protein LldG
VGNAEAEAMSAREQILSKLRPLVKDVAGAEARLHRRPRSTPPSMPGTATELLRRFETKARSSAATVTFVHDLDQIPEAVRSFLIEQGQPLEAKRGADPLLDLTPWLSIPGFDVKTGLASPEDRCGITVAELGIAETGSLMLVSTRTTPFLLNLLPETLIVLLPASRIVPLLEDAFAHWRSSSSNVVRTFTLMTGPSRTADIEQTLEIGAHGPKRELILIVEER